MEMNHVNYRKRKNCKGNYREPLQLKYHARIHNHSFLFPPTSTHSVPTPILPITHSTLSHTLSHSLIDERSNGAEITDGLYYFFTRVGWIDRSSLLCDCLWYFWCHPTDIQTVLPFVVVVAAVVDVDVVVDRLCRIKSAFNLCDCEVVEEWELWECVNVWMNRDGWMDGKRGKGKEKARISVSLYCPPNPIHCAINPPILTHGHGHATPSILIFKGLSWMPPSCLFAERKEGTAIFHLSLCSPSSLWLVLFLVLLLLLLSFSSLRQQTPKHTQEHTQHVNRGCI